MFVLIVDYNLCSWRLLSVSLLKVTSLQIRAKVNSSWSFRENASYLINPVWQSLLKTVFPQALCAFYSSSNHVRCFWGWVAYIWTRVLVCHQQIIICVTPSEVFSAEWKFDVFVSSYEWQRMENPVALQKQEGAVKWPHSAGWVKIKKKITG